MGRNRTWTDDDLIAALDGATTMREVVSRLRLRSGGASYTTVRARMEHSTSIRRGRPDPSDTRPSPWRRSFADGALTEAVAASSSLKGVFDRLGLTAVGSQWGTIRQLILDRGLSTDHWRRPLGQPNTRTGEVARFRAVAAAADLRDLAGRSRSRADLIRALGFEPRPSLYRVLREVFRDQGVTTDHFEVPHRRMLQAPPRPRRPIDELLVRGSTIGTHALKLRLIEEGVLHARCSRCGLTAWLGGPIPLELDHVDGDRTNNELSNLRFLCPNCHALTDTYRGRNVGRYARAQEAHETQPGE